MKNTSKGLESLSNSLEIASIEEQLNYTESTTEYTSTDDYKEEKRRIKLQQLENELLDGRIMMNDEVFMTLNQYLKGPYNASKNNNK